MRKAILLLCLLLTAGAATARRDPAQARERLRRTIDSVARRYNATIGVAMLGLEDGDTLTRLNNRYYPMQSVYKLPLALTILHKAESGQLALTQKVHVNKADLRRTWSPLRDKHPDGNMDMTVSELLQYTISQSDNNTCDMLFKLAKGTEEVNKYMHSRGFNEVAIKTTEAEMAAKWAVQYTNHTRPYELVRLLDSLQQGRLLAPENTGYLLQLMTASANSANRIKGLLPTGTKVAHKTGTSDTNKAGLTAATNDAGIVTLPGGRHVAIAIMVTDSRESPATNEHIIAELSRMIFGYFVEK